jgi:serine/threonine protein kinase
MPDDWQRVEELFHRASHLAANEITEFLDRECVDASERGEVERLLAAHRASDGFLDSQRLAQWLESIDHGRELPSGTRIGGYRILAPLGRGGMGAVYLAEGSGSTRVAIKIAAILATGDGAQRLQRERELLEQLEHPHIARLLDAGTTDEGTPYFVMEYVDGAPIDRWCRDHAVPLRGRVALVRAVAAAVVYAHERWIAHRDLKPSNILVAADGTPKLLDFGIAKVFDAGELSVSVTTLGRRAMTLEYASPEQLSGAPVSGASDVYSLGVVLYELAAGQSPYSGSTLAALLESIATRTPRAPTTIGPFGANPALDAIVATALQKDPAARHRSMLELHDELAAWLASAR